MTVEHLWTHWLTSWFDFFCSSVLLMSKCISCFLCFEQPAPGSWWWSVCEHNDSARLKWRTDAVAVLYAVFFECTQYRSWQWKHVSTLTYRLYRLQFRKQHSRRQFQRLTFQVYIRNDAWYNCGFCFPSCADWYAEQAVCQKTIPMPPWHVNKRWFECAVPQDFSSCCSSQALCLADAVALLLSGRFFSFEWCWFAWCCFLKIFYDKALGQSMCKDHSSAMT